ncbi:MAG: hypothetical protein WD379_08885 [Dehalococcoidia bacterium]
MPPKAIFPAFPVNEARKLADVIAQKNAGQPMRRLDVFHELGKSPTSGPSRQLVTASGAYGFTTGSYNADKLALTALGRKLAVDGDAAGMIDAVLNVDVFKRFFEKYKNNMVPAEVAAKSFFADEGVPAERTHVCWELALANGRATGLIENVSGSERILTPDHALEKKMSGPPAGAKEKRSERNAPSSKDGSKEADQPPQPSFHVDIQIHIDSSASAEQIEQVFASMARHIYRREG